MPGRGPAPKDPAQRRRRNVETRTAVELTGPVPPPELVGVWSEPTLGWWQVWCSSPQAVLFTGTDWQRLTMLAPIVERFFNGDLAMITEIRQNETMLGATVMDRQRLRMDVKRVDAEQPASSVTRLQVAS